MLAIRRRDNDKWEPPGGTLEPNETIYEGLQREVKEEVGLDIVPGALTGVYKNMARAIVALVFRCEHPGGSPIPTAEVAEVRWMEAKEVEAFLDPAYAFRLLDALLMGPPRIRIHDGVNLVDP